VADEIEYVLGSLDRIRDVVIARNPEISAQQKLVSKYGDKILQTVVF
jgi:hypothetical protein